MEQQATSLSSDSVAAGTARKKGLRVQSGVFTPGKEHCYQTSSQGYKIGRKADEAVCLPGPFWILLYLPTH